MINIKEIPKSPGIYKITSPSGKIYIGQSVNIYERIYSYKTLCCKGQIKLYRSLLKYGFKAHKFDIIEECPISYLNELETWWKHYYGVQCVENGLNCWYVDGKGRRDQGKSILQYDLNGNFIKEWPSINEINRVLKLDKSGISECCRNKQNKSNGFIWKFKTKNFPLKIEKYVRNPPIFTEEVKLKMKIMFIDKNSKPIIQYDLNMNPIKEWDSMLKASKGLNISQQNISACCTGRQQTTCNFKFSYK